MNLLADKHLIVRILCWGIALLFCHQGLAAGQSAEPTEFEIAPVLEEVTAEAEFDLWWAQIYSQTDYSGYDGDNVISDSWMKGGIHLLSVRDRDVDLFLKVRGIVDRNGDFWNNLGEVGVGIQCRPLEDYGLILLGEIVRIKYFDNGGDSSPEDEYYWDYRAGFAFWQWWGRYPWEVEKPEFYLPFQGWREVYSDGFYHNHDDHNFITTLNYKEGLCLGKIAGIRYNGYINFRVAADANADYWNNYYDFGPGFRISPFNNLDLNIAFEYNWGSYYRGSPEDRSKDYSDFGMTLAFYREF